MTQPSAVCSLGAYNYVSWRLADVSAMVMIPDFDDNGYLPAGIHAADLGEIAARFGHKPELRRVQMESLHWPGTKRI
jgi:hypothetical protein